MSKALPHHRAVSRRKRMILFAAGAACGSAIGLIVGSLLTFWIGDGTLRAIQRGIRRISGDDGHPSFDLLLQ
ncbi:hypothetical protein K2Z83_13245 [Oscillochloris sp. ZM17-4]|uniref:hypothetical protein n=1 Tax=Oscillochloris sp. ZM17-4 TaxID=2866714 RepID=UPI001C72B34C|nr:hypothetical protein [Oscillochloris sp. ZM17-4]MBX0328642.1 hypothetical protein [Oscillochloris sp. ZM17-4]